MSRIFRLAGSPSASSSWRWRSHEQWGYEKIGEQQPFPDSAVFVAVMRKLH